MKNKKQAKTEKSKKLRQEKIKAMRKNPDITKELINLWVKGEK